MTKKNKIIIFFGILLAIIVALLLLSFAGREEAEVEDITPEDAQEIQEPVQPEIDQGTLPQAGPPITIPEAPSDPSELFIVQQAKTFTERFLSFSNQNDNQHIDDVLIFVTPKMETWVLSNIKEFDSTYQGQTAKVITTKLNKTGDTSATVDIGIQTTSHVVGSKNIGYVNGTVNMVKVGETWLVDGLFLDN